MQKSYQSWFVLIAALLAFFAGNVDITAFNIAVVWVQKSLHMQLTNAQWLISGSALSFGSLLIAGGRLCDLYGYVRMFIIGLILFGLSSIAGGLAQTGPQAIIARIIQGASLALFWPAIISLSLAAFPREKHAMTMGLLMSASGLGMSLGPLLAGLLIHFASWRWVLLVNVPLSIIPIICILAFRPPEKSKKSKETFDWLGSILLCTACFAILYAVNETAQLRQHPALFIAILLYSVTAFVGLYYAIKYKAHPLIKMTVLKNKIYLGACLSRMSIAFCFMSILFLIGYYLQHVLRIPSFAASSYFLPMTLMFGCSAPLISSFTDRIGSTKIMFAGFSLIILGLALLLKLDPYELNHLNMVAALLILGLGFGLVYPTNNTIAMTVIDKQYHGVAAGFLYFTSMTFGAFAPAIATLIINTYGKSYLNESLQLISPNASIMEKNNIFSVFSGKQSFQSLTQMLSAVKISKIIADIQIAFTYSIIFNILLLMLILIFGMTVFYKLCYKKN